MNELVELLGWRIWLLWPVVSLATYLVLISLTRADGMPPEKWDRADRALFMAVSVVFVVGWIAIMVVEGETCSKWLYKERSWEKGGAA